MTETEGLDLLTERSSSGPASYWHGRWKDIAEEIEKALEKRWQAGLERPSAGLVERAVQRLYPERDVPKRTAIYRYLTRSPGYQNLWDKRGARVEKDG